MTAKKPTKKRPQEQPLAGKYLHTFEAADRKVMHYQGKIIGIDGDVCLVQLFSWMWGEPTIIEPMRKEFIYSPLCILYPDHQTWIAAGDAYNARTAREVPRRLTALGLRPRDIGQAMNLNDDSVIALLREGQP
jgi:hypothetical protein